MDIIKNRIVTILYSFLVALQMSAQSESPFRMRSVINTQEISIDSFFDADTTISVFNGISDIYGLSVSMNVVALSEDFLVRVILTDNDEEQYLVAESYKELSDNPTMTFTNYCEETSVLGGVVPKNLSLYVKDAQVYMDSIYVSVTPHRVHQAPSILQSMRDSMKIIQVQSKVDKINQYNRVHNKLWRAAVTPMSMKKYSSKMRSIGASDGISTKGLEYYAEGIFEIGENVPAMDNSTPRNSSNYVESFDWRSRHGINWQTPVKDQGDSGYCFFFTTVACMEASVNLYYNNKIDMDLSEQQVACCSGIQNPYHGTPLSEVGKPLTYVSTHDVYDEVSYPFVDSDSITVTTCRSEEITPNETARMSGFVRINKSNTDSIKNALINNGPLVSGFNFTGVNHAMLLVGYGIIHVGDSVKEIVQLVSNPNMYGLTDTLVIADHDPRIGMEYWIFKNSYANSLPGNGGYMYVIIHNNDRINDSYYANPRVFVSNFSDDDIVCEDKDGDGFYYWGRGQKPSSCPEWVPDSPDGDDSNITFGPMDEYGMLEDLNAENRDTIYVTSTDYIANRHYHNHMVVKSSGKLIVNEHDVTFHNGAKLIVENGGVVSVSAQKQLNNVELEVREGGKLLVNEGGMVLYRKNKELNAHLGSEIIIDGVLQEYDQ